MIRNVIEFLHTGEFYNVSEAVEIAKGRNERCDTVKKMVKQAKRIVKYKKV